MSSQHETVAGSEAGSVRPREDRAERSGADVRAERSPAAAGRDPGRAEVRDDTRATPSAGPLPEIRTGTPLAASPPVASGAAADRAQDADLLLDVSRLTVDELTLEVQASVAVDHLKLDAKGLDASLFLKGSLDNLVALRGEAPARSRAMGAARRAARWATPELPVAGRARRNDAADASTPEDETAAPAHASADEDDGIGAVLDGVRRRAATVAKEGGKAASLAVVGAAGGALLESKLGPRHRRGARLPKVLGGRGARGPRVPSLLSGAERAPKALIEEVQRRLS
jgi:hypothetical protein